MKNSRLRIFLLASAFLFLCSPFSLAETIIQKKTSPPNQKFPEQPFISFSGGMGISLLSIADIADYLNAHSTAPRIDEFQSFPEFFASAEIPFSTTLGVKFEYAYLFNTFTTTTLDYPLYEFVQLHMPTVFIQKLFPKNLSIIKLGAGIGYHFGSVEETYLGSALAYRSRGIGLKGEVEGNTALSESLFAYFAVDLRINFQGTLRADNGATLDYWYYAGEERYRRAASLTFFSLGLKLGLIVYV
ncbi:MAG: hypothetical protein KGZ58_05645 [Ignavibacteriales bacterium]|nr:hypothetical protein [Ignavibacteriales bacterium]